MAGDEAAEARQAVTGAGTSPVFDLDGTLADSFPFFLSVQNTLARRHGFAEVDPADIERLRGLSPGEVMRHVGLPRWKLPFVARGFVALRREQREPAPLFAGVADALAALHEAGVALAVVTANAEDNVRRTLGDAHFARLRRTECGASMFGKARRLRRVLKATGVPPQRALYIGDQIPDGDAARAAGMAFGAVAWGYATRDALARCTPDAWFDTPADLVAIARPLPA